MHTLKNAPTLGHSQAPPPPLGHCPCDVIHIFQGWNKIAEGWNKIAKGWNKIAEGWNKIAKGWNKIAERWNKIAKGWNKIAKGWNKIFGMGNWRGSYDPPPPTPPPGYGPGPFLKQIVDLFGKPLGQRSRYFTKDPKLWTFLSGAWLRGP